MYPSPLGTRPLTPPRADVAAAAPIIPAGNSAPVDVRNRPTAGLDFAGPSLVALAPEHGGLLYVLDVTPPADTLPAQVDEGVEFPRARTLAEVVRDERASGQLLKTRWKQVVDGWIDTAIGNWGAREADSPAGAAYTGPEVMLPVLRHHLAHGSLAFAASPILTLLCGLNLPLPAPMRDAIQDAVRLQIEDDALIDPDSRAANEKGRNVIDQALALPASDALRHVALRPLFEALQLQRKNPVA